MVLNSNSLCAGDGRQQLAGAHVYEFAADIETLKLEAYSAIGTEDLRHIIKIEWWGRIATLLGYSTAWIVFNPVSAFLLSLGQLTRWLLAHHVMHRGYDRVPGVPARYTSKVFARGWRRFIDWFDWIHPSAWDYEHNLLHHYNTGEARDPDVAERHTQFLRDLKIPYILKYFILALAAMTWRFTYYAPNTFSTISPEDLKRMKPQEIVFLTIKNIFQLHRRSVRALWMRCYLPYGLVHFVLIPIAFLPLGSSAAWTVFFTKILAECFINIHSFFVIGPNHTADDLYRFDFHYKDKAEFYATQVLGSANYECGNDFVDYMGIWLNYQIEHHIFPDLPMLKYREIQPRVKALCLKHGLPYRQESNWRRFVRMISVCVGQASMRPLQSVDFSKL